MTRSEAAARAAIEDSAIPPSGGDCFIFIGLILPAFIYAFRHITYMWEAIKEGRPLYALGNLLYPLAEIIPDASNPWAIGKIGEANRTQQIL